ncbi:MAG: hypothetical protein QM531_07700 [Candidatus Pacebacteria bacterium]|nr:hypothetical protein [Candidatus Paceibacterota bacterium]
MINKLIRLTVLGLVVGLASATMAGEGCGSCGDDDSGAKKKKSSETNNATSGGKK